MPTAVGSLAPKMPLRSRCGGEHVGVWFSAVAICDCEIEGPDDLQLGVGLQMGLEAAHAPDLGARAGHVGHDGHFAGRADALDQELGAGLAGRLVVGGKGLVIVLLPLSATWESISTTGMRASRPS